MLEPFVFIDKIECIRSSFQEELTFYQSFFEEPQLYVPSFDALFDQLTKVETATNLKKRTILLLRLYVLWFKKNDVHLKGYHATLFQNISYGILLIIETDFHLQRRNELFFDIIHSLAENDFKPIFKHSFPLENPYEIAYDLLSFSLDYPPCDYKRKNEGNSVELDFYIIGSGRNAKFLLHVYPKGKYTLFHRFDIEWSETLQEDYISIFTGADKVKPNPFLLHKKQLLGKFSKAIIVELMFHMEYNREYWGTKHFIVQKLFLEELVKAYRK